MSKKSDLFTDNPEMYFTGSFQEIATIIEKEWWEDKRKILTNLSRSIDFEMIYLGYEKREGIWDI